MVDTRALWASGLGVRYGRRWVFRDLGVNLPQGEVLRLSGPIGSGKSTLLRVLAGVSRPTAGVVRHRPPVVSYVPTRLRVPEGLTLGEYLTRLGRIRGLVSEEIERRRHELVDELNLSPTTVLSEASADVRCRVAIAQALLERPSLLIIDDPWSNMAAPSQVDTIELMNKRAERGCIVVFTAAPNWRPALEVTRHLTLSGGILHPAPASAAPGGTLNPGASAASGASGSAGSAGSAGFATVAGSARSGSSRSGTAAGSSTAILPPTRPDRGPAILVRIVLYGQGIALEPDTDGIISITPYADGISIIAQAEHSAEVQDLALTHNWLIRRVESA
ncbi:ATP-binding cassette domain-containing protein [Jatrophihabitans telluris]|uniref:ATP-binding cassette domain-containing protein n=1 Tax=Jatrophihabitans telluris TaxID=2038343 RepID=A0ABY4QXW5_9ACTN|nr:ATP-binding cassette domain-containing protein [Jatrophihabitans telluris]UQX88488.1 ATP-binding cassette domain-containing protein [Jatrophihabitans telluris]